MTIKAETAIVCSACLTESCFAGVLMCEEAHSASTTLIRRAREAGKEDPVTGFADAQRRAYANKVAKGFNITDVPMEFGLLVEEIGEAFSAWRKQKPVGPELADVAIFLCGLAEILGVDLDAEVAAKMAQNERREYVTLPNGTPVKAGLAGERGC